MPAIGSPPRPRAALLAVLVAPLARGQADDPPSAPDGAARVSVRDLFGRDLAGFGVVLVDWEGRVANPAIELRIAAPPETALPAFVTLTAPEPRFYFDNPCKVGAEGPSKVLSLRDTAPRSVFLSVFPDADGADELSRLELRLRDANLAEHELVLPVRVVDQDRPPDPGLAVHVDFTEDKSGFFQGEEGQDERALLAGAAQAWAAFVADPGLDPVPAGAEISWIWRHPLAFADASNGAWTRNRGSYAGFLLYAYGIDTPLNRSGGEPSRCCFQSASGVELPLRRSGGVEIEVKGNYNTEGWFLSAGDEDWWVCANRRSKPNDLCSVAQHEAGHALAFNDGYPRFAAAEARGFFDTPEILAYHGEAVAIDAAVDHFSTAVDRASRRGAFGNEYGGDMPARRWLITKLDLLLLQAVGYPLKPTACLAPLAVVDAELGAGRVLLPYDDALGAAGGIPFYDWILEEGALPPGLLLDRFTGRVQGTPERAGLFGFAVRVRDYDAAGPGLLAPARILIE